MHPFDDYDCNVLPPKLSDSLLSINVGKKFSGSKTQYETIPVKDTNKADTSEMASSDFDLDEILTELGHCGKFQIRNYILIILTIILSASYYNFVFTTLNPSYRCFIPEYETNLSSDFSPIWLKYAVPMDANNHPSRCFRYHYNSTNNTSDLNSFSIDNFNHSRTEKCDKFVFKSNKISIANTFDIYCDENLWKLTFPGTVHSIGDFISMLLTGLFSDRFGRRAVLIGGIFMSVIFGLIRTISPSYSIFVLFEFLEAVVGGAVYTSAFILGTELVAPSRRVVVGTFIVSTYAIGEVILGMVAWSVNTWQQLIWYIYAPGLLIPIYFWIVPESVRWLIWKKRYKDVEKTITKAAKTNKIVLSAQTMNKLERLKNMGDETTKFVKEENYSCEENQQTLWEALRNSAMAFRILNCSVCWITCVFVFYGLSLNSVEIVGNHYLNYIVVSLIELPGTIATYCFLNKIGRRFSLCGSLICSGIACFVFIFIPNEQLVIKLLIYLFGKFSVTMAFTIIYVVTTEIFPTPLRHSLLGICSMVGRIGLIIAPQMPLLTFIWDSLPLILFGLVSIISGLLSLLFPETRGTKLPNTIEEALQLNKKNQSDL